MKLMIVIVRDTDGDAVLQALINHGLRVTRVASTGGFLRPWQYYAMLIWVDS